MGEKTSQLGKLKKRNQRQEHHQGGLGQPVTEKSGLYTKEKN